MVALTSTMITLVKKTDELWSVIIIININISNPWDLLAHLLISRLKYAVRWFLKVIR